jgi:hypothetical protein
VGDRMSNKSAYKMPVMMRSARVPSKYADRTTSASSRNLT